MFNQDIQDVVNARLESIKDAYMDEGAMKDLRDDLLHETRAERVEADVLPGTRTLHAKVWVIGQCYEGEVDLSQYVPHLDVGTIPAQTYVARDDLEASEQDQAEADEKADKVHEQEQAAHDQAHPDQQADESQG